jgi:hypothetical protein
MSPQSGSRQSAVVILAQAQLTNRDLNLIPSQAPRSRSLPLLPSPISSSPGLRLPRPSALVLWPTARAPAATDGQQGVAARTSTRLRATPRLTAHTSTRAQGGAHKHKADGRVLLLLLPSRALVVGAWRSPVSHSAAHHFARCSPVSHSAAHQVLLLDCFCYPGAQPRVMENPTGTRNPPETRWVRVWVRHFTRGCGRGRVWSHFAGAVAGGFLLHPTRTRPVAIPNFNTCFATCL